MKSVKSKYPFVRLKRPSFRPDLHTKCRRARRRGGEPEGDWVAVKRGFALRRLQPSSLTGDLLRRCSRRDPWSGRGIAVVA